MDECKVGGVDGLRLQALTVNASCLVIRVVHLPQTISFRYHVQRGGRK